MNIDKIAKRKKNRSQEGQVNAKVNNEMRICPISGWRTGEENGRRFTFISDEREETRSTFGEEVIYIHSVVGLEFLREREVLRAFKGEKTRRMILRSGRFSARKASTRPIDR